MSPELLTICKFHDKEIEEEKQEEKLNEDIEKPSETYK